MLGMKGAPYHFEFTMKKDHIAPVANSKDNLLVFYIPNKQAYDSAVKRMRMAGYDPVRSYNPYWDQKGITFEDEEGYRIVLYHDTWKT